MLDSMPRDAKYGMTEDQMAGAINRLQKLGTKHFGIHAFLASSPTTSTTCSSITTATCSSAAMTSGAICWAVRS